MTAYLKEDIVKKYIEKILDEIKGNLYCLFYFLILWKSS